MFSPDLKNQINSHISSAKTDRWAVFCLLFVLSFFCSTIISADENTVGREEIARELALIHNSPNPFNAHTTIRYNLLQSADVKVDIFDLAGRHVVTLIDEYQNEGENFAVWKTESQPSGTYLCRIDVEGITAYRKMSMVK